MEKSSLGTGLLTLDVSGREERRDLFIEDDAAYVNGSEYGGANSFGFDKNKGVDVGANLTLADRKAVVSAGGTLGRGILVLYALNCPQVAVISLSKGIRVWEQGGQPSSRRGDENSRLGGRAKDRETHFLGKRVLYFLAYCN